MAMDTSPIGDSYFDPQNLSSRQQFRRYGYCIPFSRFKQISLSHSRILNFNLRHSHFNELPYVLLLLRRRRGFVQLGFMPLTDRSGLS